MSVNIKVTGGLNIEWGQIDPKVTGGLSIRLFLLSAWLLVHQSFDVSGANTVTRCGKRKRVGAETGWMQEEKGRKGRRAALRWSGAEQGKQVF